MSKAPKDPGGEGASLETTATLLTQAREGDASAKERLLRRYLPALRRWASGRTPSSIRHLADTDDLVQATLLRTLDQLETFESRGPGAFFAYLRQALRNQIRDQLRRAERRPAGDTLPDDLREPAASPLRVAIGREALERYDRALERLPEEQQAAIVLRVELGCSYAEIADVLARPSANAARMSVSRALVRLVELMDAG